MKTEHLLVRQLKIMMATQPLDSISVIELSNKCGVSRKTFYYHYHDVYDLLTQAFLDEKIPGANSVNSYIDLVKIVWSYYKENEAFINATLASAGKDLFFEFVYNIFYTSSLRFINRFDEEKKISVNERKSIARFYASGYSNSLVYYLSNYKYKTLEGLLACFDNLDLGNFDKPRKSKAKIKEMKMIDFDFQIPTKVYFGRGKVDKVGEILAGDNAHKVLIVIGKSSVIKSGLLNRVIKSLEKQNITYFILQGVRANPTFTLVEEGLKMVRENKVDYILPIGGGSVIDTAKCIAVNAFYNGDIRDFNMHRAKPEKALPVGAILTISAAGSEMSSSCVIQDDVAKVKMGFNSPFNRPRFVIEDPSLTISVNKEQTAYGIVDIMMHTLERYFCEGDDYELADEFALGLLKNVVDVGLICYNEPDNYDARGKIMLASSMSHCDINHIGKAYRMPVHQLEHALSGKFPKIAHGCGLAILFPAWADYYMKYETSKFATLGRRAFSIRDNDDEVAAKKCIEALREYFKALGMPSKLSEVGVSRKDIKDLVDIYSQKGNRVVFHKNLPLDAKVAEEIYLSVL